MLRNFTKMSTAIRLLEDPVYKNCRIKALEWESDAEQGQYYNGILCGKELTTRQNSEADVKKAYDKMIPFLSSDESFEKVKAEVKLPLCMLNKGHTGKCNCSPYKELFSKFHKSVPGKIETSIFSTPGNDDFIFKNRSNRNFPIQLSGEQESKIRDKKKKLSCAIPLRDGSTPLMQAAACLDWITQMINITGVRANLKDMGDQGAFVRMLDEHKIVLDARFRAFNRRLFNETGETICPVTNHLIRLDDIQSRDDSRTCPRPTDIQLGHCIPRSDNEYTIRGFNICMMTRDGNRIVGDSPFCSDEWLEKLRAIVNFHI